MGFNRSKKSGRSETLRPGWEKQPLNKGTVAFY